MLYLKNAWQGRHTDIPRSSETVKALFHVAGVGFLLGQERNTANIFVK